MTTAVQVETGRTAAPLARGRWRREHVFYTGMAFLGAAVVIIGFAPTYYLKGAFAGRYDRIANGRVHRAFALGATFIILSQPLRILIGFSAPWQAFAAWLTR